MKTKVWSYVTFIVSNTQIAIPVVSQSKAWVYGCSLVGIAGSNRAGGMYIGLLWVLCVVQVEVCDGPIARPKESCLVLCVCLCDQVRQ